MFILDYHKEKGIIKFYDESLWEDKYLQEAAIDWAIHFMVAV